MDDRKPPIDPPPIDPKALCSPGEADAAQADSVRESSSVIYFASAEEISEGFTIALRAMGFESEILLPELILQSDTLSNPEDN
jgi:type II secretory pathway component HofQ